MVISYYIISPRDSKFQGLDSSGKRHKQTFLGSESINTTFYLTEVADTSFDTDTRERERMLEVVLSRSIQWKSLGVSSQLHTLRSN